jgi:predicted nucleic acid-binding Zn ribbon protein
MQRKRKYKLTCVNCGETFNAVRPSAKYCSKACKNKVSYERHKERERVKEVGPQSVNPYFLKRGDIYKNLSSGVGVING